MDRLIHCLSAALAERQQCVVKIDDDIYDLQTLKGKPLTRFTTSREGHGS